MLSRFFTRNEQFVLIALAGALVIGSITAHRVSTESRRTQKDMVSVHEPDKSMRQRENISLNEPARSQRAEAFSQTSDFVAQPAPIGAGRQNLLSNKPDKRKIRVSVMGWVARPGAYEFSDEDRVDDAILRAGGLKEGADITDINLAAPLLDGSTLIIPRGATARIAGGRLVVRGADTSESLRNPPQYTVSGWRPSTKPSGEDSAAPHLPDTSEVLDLNSATFDQLVSLPSIGPVLAQRILDARKTQPFSSVDDLCRVNGVGKKTLEKLKPFVTVK